jgi:hypothetical protein
MNIQTWYDLEKEKDRIADKIEKEVLPYNYAA